MKATDIVGYVFDGAIYCPACIGKRADDPECSPLFAGFESDYFPCCDSCGDLIDGCTLTKDGILAELEREHVEIFEVTAAEIGPTHFAAESGPGWYWWICLPGCLPDSETYGPFESEDDASADAAEVILGL